MYLRKSSGCYLVRHDVTSGLTIFRYAMSGLATLYKPASNDKSLTMWQESLNMLEACKFHLVVLN